MIAPLALALALAAPPAGPTCALPAQATGPVCAPAAATAASSMGDAPLRDQVATLLGVIDGPVPAAAWRALPPEALPLLEQIAGGSGRSSARARALDGAAALGSDGVLHRRLAGDAATPFAVRAAAIRALGRIVPRAKLGAELSPLAERDPDARIRATAAAVVRGTSK